jgi:hypothetical protein
MPRKKSGQGESKFGKGLIPRNFRAHPPGYLAVAPVYPASLLIDEAEWPERLAEQKAKKSSLRDLREAYYETLKSLDQNGFGLCWMFSTTKASMYSRILAGLPPLRLSAYWGAGQVKNWRDEGGWGSESMTFVAQSGLPEETFCPAYKKSYDTPEAKANAALHQITKWWDGTESREQNRKIMISSFLLGLPNVLDLNWLGHSMAGCYLDSINPLVVYADNSWGAIDQFGPKGLYKLTGDKAIPDNIVVSGVVEASRT